MIHDEGNIGRHARWVIFDPSHEGQHRSIVWHLLECLDFGAIQSDELDIFVVRWQSQSMDLFHHLIHDSSLEHVTNTAKASWHAVHAFWCIDAVFSGHLCEVDPDALSGTSTTNLINKIYQGDISIRRQLECRHHLGLNNVRRLHVLLIMVGLD